MNSLHFLLIAPLILSSCALKQKPTPQVPAPQAPTQEIQQHEQEKETLATVTAKILSPPQKFSIMGRWEGATRQKGHSSHLELISPSELQGQTIEFYHFPRLKGKTIWHEVGSTIQFQIPEKYLGGLYPEKDPRHNSLIPYASKILGEVKEVPSS